MEMREALNGLNLGIVTPQDLHITETPIEEGETFADNAREKAWFYHQWSGLPTLADDSGILVEALQHELGIHTRRWGAGPDASDHHWISFFLDRMRDEPNKQARFVCSLCYIDSAGKEHLFEGTCDGVITRDLEADFLPGLPISACFKPNGYELVYSALPIEEKNRISHRGQALLKYMKFIQSQIS